MLKNIMERFSTAFGRVLAVSLAEDVGFLNTVVFAQTAFADGEAFVGVKSVQKRAKATFGSLPDALTGELDLSTCLKNLIIVD